MDEVERSADVEEMEGLEDPELEVPESMDDKEEDPDWHCQLEDKGENDVDADDEEKDDASMNNIRQVLMIFFKLVIIHFFLFPTYFIIQ